MNGKIYNYEPLTRHIGLSEVLRENVDQLQSRSSKVLMALLSTILLVFMAASIYFAMQGSVLIGIFLTLGLVAVLVGDVAKTKKAIRLRSFAQANNLIFLSACSPEPQPGMIFNEGHTRQIAAGFRAEGVGWSEIANYYYITGSGKNAQTHDYGYVHIKLPRRLPHMVLDARQNNIFGKFTNLPDFYSSKQKLSLEGDFDEHFTLYAPKEYEQDALYVFSPDIMQLLIDESSGYDVEVVDNDLYLYTTGTFKLDDPKTLERLFRLADKIYQELGEQTDYYADDRVGNRQLNIVAAPGRRLKTSGVPIFLVIIIFFIFILFQLGPSLLSLKTMLGW